MYTAKQIKEKLDLRFPETKEDWKLDSNKLYSEQEFQIMKFDYKKDIYKQIPDGDMVKIPVLATIDLDKNELWSE